MGLFSPRIDRELLKATKSHAGAFTVVSKVFPTFRFPDFYRAAEAFVGCRELIRRIDSSHYADLSAIIKGEFHGIHGRLVNVAGTRLLAVDFEKEEPFPDDCFWVFRSTHDVAANGKPASTRTSMGILRVRSQNFQKTTVELAVQEPGTESALLKEISDLSVEHSVYRNKLIQIDFQAAIEEDYGEIRSPSELTVTFRKDPQIDEQKIVLDPKTAPVIERNVVRFHKSREQLRSLGLPLQRGVLLYGPPGTGKTYTCQYLYHRLKPITMIVVAGKGLTEVKSICNFARTMQPSIVILEDVDLIFASREINLYSTGLGEMMDELDGFQKDDAVMFVLTTNAIERLEEAIKDRPGRIAQCVFFGPPTQELREKYLTRFLDRYDTSQLAIPRVARIADGGSQAFLQELVNRAVQIATETQPDARESVQLLFEHFEDAVNEMTQFAEKSTGAIVGFQPRR